MRFELDVYRGEEVERTFGIEDRFVTTGTCQDLFRLVDVDALVKAGTDDRMAEQMIAKVFRAFMDFYPLAAQLFPDMTEDDYRRTLPGDVGRLMTGLIQYAFSQLAGMEPEKNRRARPSRRASRTPSSRRWWHSATGSRPSTRTRSGGCPSRSSA